MSVYKGKLFIKSPNRSQKTTKITKMKIIFSGLALFTSTLSLTPRDFAAYDEKLRAYQNMTGIDDSTFNEIWDSGITNRETLFSVFLVGPP